MSRITARIAGAGLVAAAMAVAASCAKIDEPEVKTASESIITFVAEKPATDDATKTAWNDEGQAVTWKAGDKIRAACLRDGQYWQNATGDATDDAPAKIYASNGLSADASVASFQVPTNYKLTAAGSYRYYSIYPSSLLSSADFTDAPNASVTLKSVQELSASTFDAEADILLGRSTTSVSAVTTEAIPMEFKRMVALSKITFKNLKDAASGELVKKITLTAQSDAKLSGAATMNLLEGTADTGEAVNYVTASSSEGVSLDENGSISVWFSTFEFTATRLTVSIETDKANYTRDIDLSSNSKTFVRNKRNLLSVNMASAEKTYKTTTVEFSSLGNETWGKTSIFSGTEYDEVTQTSGGVTITYTRNGSSLYANSSAIRFYKSNTIKIEAPAGYIITSIILGKSGSYTDETTDVDTCTTAANILSWTGSASSVTFTRPSDAKSYITLSSVTVTIATGTNPSPDPTPTPSTDYGWLELPAATTGSNYYAGNFVNDGVRNYSYLYDKTKYTTLWAAYPLAESHTSGSNKKSSWSYNPDIAQSLQINVVSNSYGSNYGQSDYSRGHMVPNADRTDSGTRNKQVYYVTNQTPQLQNKFNGSIWSSLETAIRNLTSSTDTVYVVTGAAFQKVGGSEEITYFTANSGISPSSVPVPNYFWKVLLKVKRSGTTITSASAIGFWLEHKEYETGSSYSSYAVSVDTIEQFTGFDFFVNLPDTFEASAETNSSWSTFQNF